MREMKDSGVEWIGEIPRHWKLIRLKNLIESREGGAWGEDATGSVEDMVCLRIADFDYQKYRFKTQGDLTIRHYKRNVIERLLLSIGDILVEKSGGGEKTPVGRAVIFDKDFPALYANFMDRLRCKKDVNPYWLLYNWVNLYTNNYTRPYIKQTTGIQNLDISTLLSSQFAAIPPDYEQNTILNAISEKTERVNTLIQNVQTQIEKLKAYKQSLITEVVTKGLDPTVPMKDSGVAWIGEIPEKWQMRKANTLSERIVVGVVIRPSEYFDIKGTIPFLRGLNVKDYQISTENLVYITEQSNQLLSKSIVYEGDILIVRDGNIGASCIVPPELAGANVVSMIIFTPNSEITSPYICYCLNSLVGKHQFELTKIGSALTHTSVSAVSRLVFPLPAVEEQNSITAYLDKKCAQIDRLIAIKQAKIEKLEQYKRSLIYEYVTGKKEVV